MVTVDKTYVSPAIGFIIMVVMAIASIDTASDSLPIVAFFFAIGAVLFIAGYIGASIQSLKTKDNEPEVK